MKFPVDLRLFDYTPHSPSVATLSRTLGTSGLSIIDFSIPVNPYFPTPEMFSKLGESLVAALRYYPSTNRVIAEELAGILGVAPEHVVVANGSTEIITFINLLLIRASLAIPIPTFSRWTAEPIHFGRTVHVFPTDADDDFSLDVDKFLRFVRDNRARAAVICNPNNPTGAFVEPARLLSFLAELSDLDL